MGYTAKNGNKWHRQRGALQMTKAISIKEREVIYLQLDKVQPNPYQPRRIFERTSLDELASSIKEYGVIQPISVRLINGHRYELVAGERRLRASKIAGLSTIPAIVVNISDQDSAVIALIENLQRKNLHYLEEAEGFQNLMQDYGFTQEEMAMRVGKNQSTIANKLRILRLSKEVQKLLLEHQLTERHARALLKLTDEYKQVEIITKIVKDGLTVRKTEELVEKALQSPEVKETKNQLIYQYIRDVRILANSIKGNLEVVKKSGIGTEFDMVQTENGYDIHIKLLYNNAG